MRNPFKKNSPSEEAVTEGEQTEASAEHKKKTKLKISLKNIISRESDEDAAKAKAEKAEEKARIKAEKLRAKEEKKQRAKETAEEPAEEAATEAAEATDETAGKKKPEKPEKIKRSKDGEKKRPPLVLLLGIGAVVVAGIVVGVVLFMNRGPSVADRLQEAADLSAAGSFEESSAIYQELITEDAGLAAAYLGQAENQVLQEDIGAAISTLTLGFEMTEDPQIETRMNELITQKEEAEAATEPPTESATEAADNLPSEPIVWQDTALEAMVRLAMGREGSDPIMTGEARQIKTLKLMGSTHAAADDTLMTANTLDGYTVAGTLYTERGEIRSLADLQYFTSLTKLTIGYNQVSDLSGLASLSSLETLGLYCNTVSDLSPLAGLTSLRFLYLYGNVISDLAPLSSLTSLEALYVQNNRLTDISPLAGLTSLRELYLNSNEITDISAVSNLTGLRSFYARNNLITDFSPIWELPALTDTAIDGNPGS